MALPNESQRSFRLYVTHVDGVGHFLKISGQLDRQFSLMVESLFETARENLEKGIGAVPPAAIIHEGLICAAKYKDGRYYRVKVINTKSLSTGLVGVHFIDYGNKDIISLSAIRFLDKYNPMFLQLRGQATDYYLSSIMHPSGCWDELRLLNLQMLLCNAEYPAVIEGLTCTFPIISVQYQGYDFSTRLVANSFGTAVPIAIQQVLMNPMVGESPQVPNWAPNLIADSSLYLEHVPFLMNENFPSNPASAMRLQQNVTAPFTGAIVPPPSAFSQRLLLNKVSSGPVKSPPIQPTPPAALNNSLSPKQSATYTSRWLKMNSQHKVFVSYAEEGPELFSVHLVTDNKKLQDMMDDINRRRHSSLAEPPRIGTVCLGRMSGDRIICRASVINLSGSQCKLLFVDFGDTVTVSCDDIFDIPEEFVKPNVFAMRFCLSGLKKFMKGPYLNKAFKQLVNGKLMTLRVVAPEGTPLIQYGELYLDNKNVLDLLQTRFKDKIQFKWIDMLALGSRASILVTYVDSCIKFYVQLSDKIDDLTAVMEAVKTHCECTSSPGELPVGIACCARFPVDEKWYRAKVLGSKNKRVLVAFVDYGNEVEVHVSDLRTITPDLIKLPAQAMKCALKGFEDKPVESKTSNQLEMLALEKTLTANVMGVLSSDTMLVSLVDDTTSPPLDVALKMKQLSQPRNNVKTKPTTPVSKAAPDQFTPPESADHGKGIKRDLRDDRRPREDDDFGQRGGRFRNSDSKFNADEWEEKEDEWNSGAQLRNDRFGQNRVERRDRGQKQDVRDRCENRERGDRDRTRSNNTPRDRADRADRSDTSDKRSNKRSGRATDYKIRGKFNQVQYKELPDPIPLETTFEEPTIESEAQHEVSVTWIISPKSFYTQIVSLQPKFLKMMRKISILYKDVKSFTGTVPVGASVLAKYPSDGVLYRATVVSVQPCSKFIVQYVDFGNKQLVDARDIWQLDRQLMELPKMAIHCSLIGVASPEGEWKADPEIDLCFNAPSYQCVFQECVEGHYQVFLWNNGASVVDMLVEKQLAVLSEQQSSVAVKDAPIDLNIVVGQHIPCKVTHVESYDKFCAQLDLDKAELIENAIANFDVNLLTPLAQDTLTDGLHCTVKHEGNIYRALLTDTSDADNISALLPDYGNTITTSLSNLMIVPAELCVYYYQSLNCCLKNYTAESNTLIPIEELKTKLTGNKFIVYVHSVEALTYRLQTTLYELSTGKKLALFERDEGASADVVPLCSRTVLNYNFGRCRIQHLENLNEIYLQKVADIDKVRQLRDRLYVFYDEGTAEPLEEFSPGTLCAAKSSAGDWRRAAVLGAVGSELTLRFLDYGNKETVPEEAVMKLVAAFHEPCAQALVASLGMVALTDDAAAQLSEWTTDKEVQVTLDFGTDGWLASLHLHGVDLSIKLFDEKLATPRETPEETTAETAPVPETEETVDLASLPPGRTQFDIVPVDSPGRFWLRMADEVDKIEDVQTELAAGSDAYENLETRETGTLRIAKYSADDLSYRAEVLDRDSDITTVRFVDYGNADVLDNVPGLLETMPETQHAVETAMEDAKHETEKAETVPESVSSENVEVPKKEAASAEIEPHKEKETVCETIKVLVKEEEVLAKSVEEAPPALVEEAPASVEEAPASVEEAPPKKVPASVEEVPASVEKAPASVEEVPASVEEAPASVEEAPASVEEAPPSVEEVPASVEEVPALVKEAPASVEEVPALVEEVPASVEEVSASFDEAPSSVEEVLASVEEVPASVEDAPASVEEAPPSVDEVPASVAEVLASVEEVPPSVEEVPPSVEEVPASVEEVPASVEEAPASVEEAPPSVEEVPASVEEVPASVEEVSASVEEVPASVEEVPASVEEVSASVEEVPPSVEEVPASVVKVPASVEEAPASVEETPPSVEEVPASVEEVPASVEEAPASVEEAPPSVEEVPPSVEEVPASVEEVPASVEEAPASVEEAPPSVEEVPASVEEVPASVEEVSASVEEVPASVEEVPASVEEVSASVEEVPPSVEEVPASVVKVPASVEEAPASVEETPPSVEEVPASVEEVPASVEEAPASVEEAPPSVEEDPASVEEVPASVGEVPASVEEAPPSVEEVPASVEEVPAAVEEAPPSVEEGPASVEEVPATVEEVPASVEEVPDSVEEVPASVEDAPASVEEVPASVEEVPASVEEIRTSVEVVELEIATEKSQEVDSPKEVGEEKVAVPVLVGDNNTDPEEIEEEEKVEDAISLESNHTVIENKSVEANPGSLNESREPQEELIDSSNQDSSCSTLESSNATIRTPERDNSKDSINTDTGYTSSEGTKDGSPVKEPSNGPAKTKVVSENTVGETIKAVVKKDENTELSVK